MSGASTLRPAPFAGVSRRRGPFVEAERPCAEVHDEERASQHREVLHEHDLLQPRQPWVGDPPEAVHRQRHRHKEEDEQDSSDARPDAQKDTDPSYEGDDAGHRHEHTRPGHPLTGRIGNRAGREVPERRQDEDGGKKDAAQRDEVLREVSRTLERFARLRSRSGAGADVCRHPQLQLQAAGRGTTGEVRRATIDGSPPSAPASRSTLSAPVRKRFAWGKSTLRSKNPRFVAKAWRDPNVTRLNSSREPRFVCFVARDARIAVHREMQRPSRCSHRVNLGLDRVDRCLEGVAPSKQRYAHWQQESLSNLPERRLLDGSRRPTFRKRRSKQTWRRTMQKKRRSTQCKPSARPWLLIEKESKPATRN